MPGGTEDGGVCKNKTYKPNFEVRCISEYWAPDETFGEYFNLLISIFLLRYAQLMW